MNTHIVLAESRSASTSLTADQAIILYRASGVAGAPTMAMLHPIHAESTASPPTIGAGEPLGRDTMELIMRQFLGQEGASAEPTARRMLTDVLYMGDGVSIDRLVWHVPARRLPIFFRTGQKNFDDLFRDVSVLWPALLFVAEPGSLRVFALAQNTRPTPETPVYFAPFFNVNRLGAMCSGNVRLPNVLRLESRDKWETAFYESAFTHSNYGGVPFVKHRGGHEGLWRELIDEADRPGFPNCYLVRANRFATLGAAPSPGEPLTVGKVIEL